MKSAMKNTLKKMVCLVFALTMLFSVTAFAQEDDSLQKVLDKGTFLMGLDPAFPPMGYDEDGELKGYDIDVAKEVCRRLGVELVLQPVEWMSKEMELNSYNIDCIWNGMSKNADREESMQLSMPYLANNQVVVVLNDTPIYSFADLAGKTVGLQGASSAEDALNEAAELKATLNEVIPVDDYAIALMDLDVKGVDAVFMDEVVAKYYIEQKKANYRILDETLVPEEYVVGFRKGDVTLCEAVEAAMQEMVADGTMAQITEKWFGSNISLIK